MDGSAIAFTSGNSSLFALSKKASHPDFVAAFDLTFGAVPADGRDRDLAQKIPSLWWRSKNWDAIWSRSGCQLLRQQATSRYSLQWPSEI
jgi:hypothetical protein